MNGISELNASEKVDDQLRTTEVRLIHAQDQIKSLAIELEKSHQELSRMTEYLEQTKAEIDCDKNDLNFNRHIVKERYAEAVIPNTDFVEPLNNEFGDEFDRKQVSDLSPQNFTLNTDLINIRREFEEISRENSQSLASLKRQSERVHELEGALTQSQETIESLTIQKVSL
jgi:hypothetical protein